MIAMAIMGLSLIYLFEAQARSIRLAAKGRALNIATQLAREKLVECKYDLLKKGFTVGDYSSEGTFAEEGQEDYRWECHGVRFNMPPPSPEAITKAMKAQGKDPNQMGAEFGANMLAPFFGLVSTTLGDSIRELVLIVRWKDGEVDEDLKVVTHVTDLKPISALAAMLPDTVGGMPGQQKPQSPPSNQTGPAGMGKP